MIIPDNLLRLMSPADRKQYGRAGWTLEECQARVDGRIERKEHNIVTSYCNRHEIPCIHSATHKRPTNNVGLPDFIILWRNHALIGEMKIGKRKLSDGQIRMAAALQVASNDVHIWHDAAEAIRAIQSWIETLDKQLG
jgi:hypothetical protein